MVSAVALFFILFYADFDIINIFYTYLVWNDYSYKHSFHIIVTMIIPLCYKDKENARAFEIWLICGGVS